jgi:rhamnulose-1-phosphate aldolase
MDNLLSINDNLKKTLSEISLIAGILFEKGWAEGNSGNISVNITQLFDRWQDVPVEHASMNLKRPYKVLAGQCLFVSDKGISMHDISQRPEECLVFCEISENGDILSYSSIDPRNSTALKPTSELPAHLAIHEFLISRHRSENTIVHAHIEELLTFTHDAHPKDEASLNHLLQSALPEIIGSIPKGIGLTPFRRPGSEEIARVTVESLKHHDVILWDKHGIISIGTDPTDCLNKIGIVTKAAKMYFE